MVQNLFKRQTWVDRPMFCSVMVHSLRWNDDWFTLEGQTCADRMLSTKGFQAFRIFEDSFDLKVSQASQVAQRNGAPEATTITEVRQVGQVDLLGTSARLGKLCRNQYRQKKTCALQLKTFKDVFLFDFCDSWKLGSLNRSNHQTPLWEAIWGIWGICATV